MMLKRPISSVLSQRHLIYREKKLREYGCSGIYNLIKDWEQALLSGNGPIMESEPPILWPFKLQGSLCRSLLAALASTAAIAETFGLYGHIRSPGVFWTFCRSPPTGSFWPRAANLVYMAIYEDAHPFGENYGFSAHNRVSAGDPEPEVSQVTSNCTGKVTRLPPIVNGWAPHHYSR